MAKQRLNIRFHDPNPKAKTADLLAQVFIQASKLKLKKLLEAAVSGK